jgi:YesN/AraC family two-component response regulator
LSLVSARGCHGNRKHPEKGYPCPASVLQGGIVIYTLILADDNNVERTYLTWFIKTYYPQEFRIVGEARDGLEVLELSRDRIADLYLLDIQMPKLDGLEAAEQLRQRDRQTTILFITSYAEFSYAKKALELGVSDYLLKPYDDAKLQETMEKVLRSLERREGRQSSVGSQAPENGLLDMKARYVLDKILVNHEDWHDPHSLLSYQPGRLDAGKAVVLFPCGDVSDSDRMSHILKRIFSKRDLHALLVSRGEEIVLFLFGDRVRDFQDLETSIQRARSFLRDENGTEIFSGVSSFVVDMQLLEKAYREAVAFLLQVAPDPVRSLHARNLANVEKTYQSERQLLHVLLTRKDRELDTSLAACLREECETTEMRYLLFLMHLTISEIFGQEEEAMGRFLADRETLDATEASKRFAFLCQTARTLAGNLEKGGGYHNVRLARNAIQMILRRFRNKVTLQDIADELEVSYSHLSKCFKQVTGSSFNDFLLKTRMEAAKRLLRDTSRSISQVGKDVGIEDQYYFSKSFKKYTGITPSDFAAMYAVDRKNP